MFWALATKVAVGGEPANACARKMVMTPLFYMVNDCRASGCTRDLVMLAEHMGPNMPGISSCQLILLLSKTGPFAHCTYLQG